ncbi:MAG: pimeloyl-ACP methyl ester carboxylesterase [Gammaproteobacteria bacterium]|jgi:pimeloyl-ACP methyl ester carboxylesterase
MQRTSNGTPVWIDGSGPPVVLIHGVMMDHRMWEPQVRALHDAYTVIRYDMLGHGQAPDAEGERTLEEFVAQAREVIAECCSAQRPALGGFSMGGLVTQTVAARHWSDLRAVMLLNTAFERSASQREAVARRLGLMEQGGVESVVEPAMQRWFNAKEKRERSAEIGEVIGWMRDDEFTPKIKAYRVFVNSDSPSAEMLRAVQCPALVMTGDGDVGSTSQMSRRMAEELPAAQLHIQDNQQHMMPFLDADRVNVTMREFLDRLNT